jgi:hypothetical protein
MTIRPITIPAALMPALIDGRMTQYWEPLTDYALERALAGGINPRVPGDLLWVREAWMHARYRADNSQPVDECGAIYRADGCYEGLRGWRSSSHMPRRFSRFTLAVTQVRIARVQDATEANAVACGFGWSDRWEGFTPCQDGRFFGGTAIASFAAFWTARHGPDAWDRNDWCIVTDFTAHRCNVDMMENGR